MRRNPGNSFARIVMVRVYRDDLERLHAGLARVCKSVSITGGDYTLDDISEIADLPTDRVKTFGLTGHDPFVSVSFRPDTATIQRVGDSDEAVALAVKITGSVEETRRRFAWVYSYWTAAVVGIVSDVPFVVRRADVIGRWPAVAITLAGFAFICGLIYVRMWRGALVYTRTRRESVGFFRRTSDGFIIAITAALVGVAAASLVAWLT